MSFRVYFPCVFGFVCLCRSLPPSLHPCTHIHPAIHAYIHTYIHTYARACIHPCIHAHIHIFVVYKGRCEAILYIQLPIRVTPVILPIWEGFRRRYPPPPPPAVSDLFKLVGLARVCRDVITRRWFIYTEKAEGNFTWGGGELIKCIDPNEGEALRGGGVYGHPSQNLGAKGHPSPPPPSNRRGWGCTMFRRLCCIRMGWMQMIQSITGYFVPSKSVVYGSSCLIMRLVTSSRPSL